MQLIPLRRFALLGAALASTAIAQQASPDASRRSTEAMTAGTCLPAEAPAEAAAEVPPPVLVEGLGYVGIEPDSDSAEARAWFAQGVQLIWAFDEAEAIRAFAEAQRIDPNCAMCFFGEAWARSPTLNLQPRTPELAAARAAARRALALAEGLSPRDRVLVDAAVLRTRDGEDFSNRAYADFLERAARRMPDDDMIAVLAADAHMIAAERGARPAPAAQRLLERVLARNPDHGGAIHLYIHLTDWIDRQHLAVPYAERLAGIAPAASHLVHMPSHTFYGVGRYQEAAATNVAAIAADRAYVGRVRPPDSAYRTGLDRHNMHFTIQSALIRGDGATALAMGSRYRAEHMTGEVSLWARLIGGAAWYADGLHGGPEDVLAGDVPEHAADKAFRHYARGEIYARLGDAGRVAEEAAGIAALLAGPEASFGPAAPLIEILRHVLDGRAAMVAGRYDEAAAAYRRGMQAQLAMDAGNDPPPFWYSVRRSLGVALLAGGDARGARRQLEASLARWPDDPLALYALSQAEQASGRTEAAARNLARARALWAGDVTAIPLTRI